MTARELAERIEAALPIIEDLKTGQECPEYAFARGKGFEAMTYCPEAFEALRALPEAIAALHRVEALEAENATLRNVAKQAAEGWDNAIEMGLLPVQHHAAARIMRDDARAALKGDTGDEGRT